MSGLGERESGTAKLEEAVAAYREALKEWTREAAPTQHASVQEKLAACLGFVRTASWAIAAGRQARRSMASITAFLPRTYLLLRSTTSPSVNVLRMANHIAHSRG